VVESRGPFRALRDNGFKYDACMFYVYLLENANGKGWYIGYSANLKQRIERHQKGDGAQTTKRKQNWSIIYYEAYKDEQDAKGRERFLKSGSGRKYLKKQLAHYLK
jgi:putative endonuclease